MKEVISPIRAMVNIDGVTQEVLIMPITRLDCIEDSAETLSVASAADNIPVMDSADNGQMKKITVKNLFKPFWGEVGTVTLENTETYPFNNSVQTVALKNARTDMNYIVIPEVVSAVGSSGEIHISDVLENGFKISFDGSASEVTVKYKVMGGYFV